MKAILTASAVALAALLAGAGPVGAADHTPSRECDPHDFDTYKVEIAPSASKVERGEVARVTATVYRSVGGDGGLAPADGAHVVVALSAGRYVRGAGATTDHTGRATLEIRLDGRFPRGWADATARATSTPAELPCDPVQEAGSAHVERFLRVF